MVHVWVLWGVQALNFSRRCCTAPLAPLSPSLPRSQGSGVARAMKLHFGVSQCTMTLLTLDGALFCAGDGRVRIRCDCGGKHGDGKSRMHANWRRVEPKSKKEIQGTYRNM